MPKSIEVSSHFCGRLQFASCVIASVLIASAPVLADPGAELPAGPKEILEQWAKNDVAALAELLDKDLNSEAWQAEFGEIEGQGSLTALTAYLALNAPVQVSGADVTAVLTILPPDGKELFLQNCLSCHGGERYFLQQSKTVDGWMAIFDAPYHRRLLVEGVERETFVTYAAETAPLSLDTVPEELRDRAE